MNSVDLEQLAPCICCGTMEKAWYLQGRDDYRFIGLQDEVKGLCEQCRVGVWLASIPRLKLAYHKWLERHYPTPSYVYGLLDPRDRLVHYIGRAGDVQRRIQRHRQDQDSSQKSAWVCELHELGLTFEWLILSRAIPGYYMVELEARWICEGIKRGWPLTNKEAQDPHILRSLERRMPQDVWNCHWSDLPIGDQVTLARINVYATWSEQPPATLPHFFIYQGARGYPSTGRLSF